MRIALIAVCAMVAGYFALVVPVFLSDPDARLGSFLEVTWYAVEHVKLAPMLVGLFVIGLALGVGSGGHLFLLGYATMAAFPLLTIVDMAIFSPKSHNLWPLEFAFYSLYASPSLLGAGIGQFARERFATGGNVESGSDLDQADFGD